MSTEVSLEQLAETLQSYAYAYLLTVTDQQRAHAVAVTPIITGENLLLGDVGKRTRANLAARPSISLVWPPTETDGYSLIVDGESSTDGGELTVRPTRAVLHRPAPGFASGPSACGSDCVPIDLKASGQT